MQKFLKILMLEDSRDDAELIERELISAGIKFSCTIVNKRNEFESALSDVKPDVIISDHSLPQFNSIEALKLYRAYQTKLNLSAPFILVTGAVSEEFAVQCIKAGVDDYILKDRLRRLPAAIQNSIHKIEAETDRKEIMNSVIANEAMMREAEKLAQFGSWQADLYTDTYKWSDETFRIYGYEPNEVTPSYPLFLSHVHPDDKAWLKTYLDRAIETAEASEVEFRIHDKNGALKYIQSKIVVKRNEEGLPVTLIGFNLDITARKLTENELQKSQQEYKSLFEQNPDAVYSLDLNGRFINANEGVIKLSGLDKNKLLRMDFGPFANTEDREAIYAHFQAATKGSPQNYQARFVDAQGKQLFLDITNMPIIVDDQIVGVYGIAKNITEKKELQALLDKAHRLAMIGGWEIDLRNRKCSWTEITKEIHEVEKDFAPDFGSFLNFYKDPLHRQAIEHALTESIELGKSFNLELKILSARGNERWVKIIGDADLFNGTPIRVYGSLQDISERKRAEEGLQYTLREKVTILESIGDAFFAVNNEFVVTYWNNMAESMFGLAKEQVLGTNLEAIIKTFAPSFSEQLRRALLDNSPVDFQEYHSERDVWMEVSVYPSASGLSVYIRDITDLKKYLQAIEFQNQTLKEIGWIQSHKIRAPLSRMMGLINLVRDFSDVQTDNMNILKLIQDSAHELDALIREIVRKTEEVHGAE